jgi:hypothetical protein
MKQAILIILLLLTSCIFTNHSPDENTLIYEQTPSSIVLSHNFWRENFDYSSWKLLYDVDRGYIYDGWMEPYGPVCSFGDFKVYRWVGLPKVYDTLEECMRARRLL